MVTWLTLTVPGLRSVSEGQPLCSLVMPAMKNYHDQRLWPWVRPLHRWAFVRICLTLSQMGSQEERMGVSESITIRKTSLVGKVIFQSEWHHRYPGDLVLGWGGLLWSLYLQSLPNHCLHKSMCDRRGVTTLFCPHTHSQDGVQGVEPLSSVLWKLRLTHGVSVLHLGLSGELEKIMGMTPL